MLCVTDTWRQIHQGASMGLMVVKNIGKPANVEAGETCKRELEAKLRQTFTSKEELVNYFPISVYSQYYKQYKKTYHVLQQLESVVFKEKSIPSVSPAVEAMFMAELKNGLLTAGHDYDVLHLPLTLDAAAGQEQYTLINGKEQRVKAQDMILSDTAGIISSIIYGPDRRTRIDPETRQAVYTVYAPAGIPQELVNRHLTDIYAYIRLMIPGAFLDWQEIVM